MQNTIKILVTTTIFLLFSGSILFGQVSKKKEPEKVVVEAEGVREIATLLGEGLWFEFKKRLNLVSEKELIAKKKEVYQVKVGKMTFGHKEKD